MKQVRKNTGILKNRLLFKTLTKSTVDTVKIDEQYSLTAPSHTHTHTSGPSRQRDFGGDLFPLKDRTCRNLQQLKKITQNNLKLSFCCTNIMINKYDIKILKETKTKTKTMDATVHINRVVIWKVFYRESL